MDRIRELAKKDAEFFLENAKEYRMGQNNSEKPNIKTRYLSQTFEKSVKDGVKMLFSVDEDMSLRLEKQLETKEYTDFADKIRSTVKNGGKVVFSGCGSSGRLAMQLERCWRSGIEKLVSQYPGKKDRFIQKNECIGNIMTGGDYAVIRAAEAFEDSLLLGRKQEKLYPLSKKDILVGITASGEAASVLGTASQALDDGATVYMLICSDPEIIKNKTERAKRVYLDPNCKAIKLDCGQMALTGSTRMQAATYTQFVCEIALEKALDDMAEECGFSVESHSYSFYGENFRELCFSLSNNKTVEKIALLTNLEKEIYEKNGFVTYFSDEYMLDILTDTTERAPTFMTPPFKPKNMKEGAPSWAFAKNPIYNTKQAWERCFLRKPNCIDWDEEVYRSFGMTSKQISKIPDLSLSGIMQFEVGNEISQEREGKNSMAVFVGKKEKDVLYPNISKRFEKSEKLTLEETGINFFETKTDVFEHLALKMMLNALSTGTMALMGRITGNWMTHLAMSNKKLTDRSARIVADLCGVDYEKALEEVFYSYEFGEEHGIRVSPAGDAISRLGTK